MPYAFLCVDIVLDYAFLCAMMRVMVNRNWPELYADLLAKLDGYVEHARWTFCGLGACVDAVLSVHDAVPRLLAASDPAAQALGEMLARRAEAGIGGEVRVEWDGGPAWLDAALQPATALGGTGPHAARVLTALGTPTLLALEHRDAEQMAYLDGGIHLARGSQAVAARDIAPYGLPRPKIYIFEFTAGRSVCATAAPRSSRIIVRFTDPDTEDDPEFERLSIALAEQAGAGVLSGFSAVRGRDLDRTLRRARELALRWRKAGVPVVHLELAGFDTPALRDRTLDGLRGAYSSLGLSQSEYQALVPGDAPETETVVATARRLEVDRLCVHADAWALTVTRGDPDHERTALMAGCLLASTRAALGRPSRPVGINPDAVFEGPPDERRCGDWNVVACAAPYLPRPATTLGLGDTFMAGCLLVLGQAHHGSAAVA